MTIVLAGMQNPDSPTSLLVQWGIPRGTVGTPEHEGRYALWRMNYCRGSDIVTMKGEVERGRGRVEWMKREEDRDNGETEIRRETEVEGESRRDGERDR